MKILYLGATDNHGGAAKAGYRIFKGLCNQNHQVKMYVRDKYSVNPLVLPPSTKFKKYLSRFWYKVEDKFYSFYKKKKIGLMTSATLSKGLLSDILKIETDLYHMHWVSGDFLSVNEISKLQKPVIWTMHDMWAFTGGCHYSDNCKNYENKCLSCPHLGSNSNYDFSTFVWNRKMNLWKNLPFTIICPSRWMMECAQKSYLFKNKQIEYIPYGIDLNEFKPEDKIVSRKLLNLQPDKLYILFGAMGATDDPRKGFYLLKESLLKLSEITNNKNNIEILIFGAEKPEKLLSVGFKINYLGIFNDALTLKLLYNAADVFVAPSMEDNLPLTVMESLACGTPVVAFNVGGIPDMVEHKKNGYLAKKFDTTELAHGLDKILSDLIYRNNLSEYARKTMEENFNLDLVVEKHLQLYKSILNR